jgi:hypothetical protein
VNITADLLVEKLKQAEDKRDDAIAGVQHWEGRAAAIRELLAQVNQPEPTRTDEH